MVSFVSFLSYNLIEILLISMVEKACCRNVRGGSLLSTDGPFPDNDNAHHSHHHHHHHYEDSLIHNHDHSHSQGTLQNEHFNERNIDDSFYLLGKKWSNSQEFIDSGSRCGAKPLPGTKDAMEQELKSFQDFRFPIGEDSQTSGSDGGSINISTWIHIVMDDKGKGDISNSRIAQQMKVLNEAFAGDNSMPACSKNKNQPNGAKTPFTFSLKMTTRTKDSSLYNALPNSPAGRRMSKLLRRGDCSDLNLFFNDAGPPGSGYQGYATFPIECLQDQTRDGAFMINTSVPGSGDTPFDQGKIAVHEVGHWLGLFHTFEGRCVIGDRVKDTPAERTATDGCPERKNTCPFSPGNDPIHNYMDYSHDCCLTQFTNNQNDRIIKFWDMYRSNNSISRRWRKNAYEDNKRPDAEKESSKIVNYPTNATGLPVKKSNKVLRIEALDE